MNAAARLVHEKVLSQGFSISFWGTKSHWGLVSLMGFVILSAVTSVYMAEVNRMAYANLQQAILDQGRMQVNHAQLLLEESTLKMQSRIERVASKQLKMILPDTKSMIVIHE